LLHERAQKGIDEARERAVAADQHAQTADQRAGDTANLTSQASQAADANRQEAAKLRGVAEGRGRTANARNRGVEVKVYCSDHLTGTLPVTSTTGAGGRTTAGEPNQ